MKIETGLVLGIEGADGSGKSTVSKYIAKKINEMGYQAHRVPVIEGSHVGSIHRAEYISKEMNPLPFLNELAANNDRPWFQAHRDEYEQVRRAWIADIDRLTREELDGEG